MSSNLLTHSKIDRNTIADQYKLIQDSICSDLEALDRKSRFEEDLWEREGGGGGRTRIIRNGNVFEKGGVNFSEVFGTLPPTIQKELKLEGDQFYATGISIVLHPNNPHVPIIHMNIRYFEIAGETYWFGGGIDLTPHYIDPKLATLFHTNLNNICTKYSAEFYPKFKEWADNYFFIKHRNETRGIGGIFYDRVKENENLSKEDIFNFSCDLGNSFTKIYRQQAEGNINKTFTEEEKRWQLLRRGRYVEFNLVYDRGTKFGLETSGRIESILMSLPEMASWMYDFKTEVGSKERYTLDKLKKGIDWV